MSKKIVTFKADPSDIERWKEALVHDGRTLSQICRAALDRLAKRVEDRNDKS